MNGMVWKTIEIQYYFVTSKYGIFIPLQALTGPEDSRRMRLPDFKKIRI
jgi:hypothetical protein